MNACSRAMHLWSRGHCEGMECIQCRNNLAACQALNGNGFMHCTVYTLYV